VKVLTTKLALNLINYPYILNIKSFLTFTLSLSCGLREYICLSYSMRFYAFLANWKILDTDTSKLKKISVC